MTRPNVVASIEILFALPPDQRPAWLTAHPAEITDAFVEALKARADDYCGSDIQAALQVAELIKHAAEIVGRDDYRALGLLAEGNAWVIGYGDYEAGLSRFDESGTIYKLMGRDLDAARVVAGRLFPLARTGRLAEAYADFAWAQEVFKTHAEWRRLAILLINFGNLLGNQGADREALARFDEAANVLGEIDDEQSRMDLGGVAQNRSVVLRNLGRFDDAVAAGCQAAQILTETDQLLEAARARQNLGVTYVEMGDYGLGLQMVEEARQAFEGQHLARQSMRLDLYAAACLLDLGRPLDVIDLVAKTRAYFDAHDGQLEGGQALNLAAIAHLSLGQPQSALADLSAAVDLLRASGNRVWLARVARLRAKVLAEMGQFDEARGAALEAQQLLDGEAQPLERLRLNLDLAELALAMDDRADAEQLLTDLAAPLASEPVPSLRFDFYRLLARSARAAEQPEEAFTLLEQALHELDGMRGRLLPEFQSDFLANKQAVFEAAVACSLDLGRPQQALAVIERTKARALVDRIRGRVEQPVRPRQREDQPLVAELNQLLAERDRLVRRWQGSDEDLESLETGDTESQRQAMHRIATVESAIEERWRRLLVRSADYASDSALTQSTPEDLDAVLAALPSDSAVVMHVNVEGQLLAFVAHRGGVSCRRLSTFFGEVRRLVGYLHRNFSELPRTGLPSWDTSRQEAQGILSRLDEALLGPIHDELQPFANLVIVPHAELHYLPFHALYRDDHYLVEERRVSYLPSLGTLRQRTGLATTAPRVAVFGRSRLGYLPGVLEEAREVAEIWGVRPQLEDEATLQAVAQEAGRCQILHLAAHGAFRADNPLFSGISLADGELTTLRIFNDLQFDGNLVVLSACETAQGTIGGGDELQGLMRAFLYRGASALVLTQWQAHDASAMPLMACYHQLLHDGQPKADALCNAQRAYLHEARAAAQEAFTHPFFWAPFIHVGDVGPIKEMRR